MHRGGAPTAPDTPPPRAARFRQLPAAEVPDRPGALPEMREVGVERRSPYHRLGPEGRPRIRGGDCALHPLPDGVAKASFCRHRRRPPRVAAPRSGISRPFPLRSLLDSEQVALLASVLLPEDGNFQPGDRTLPPFAVVFLPPPRRPRIWPTASSSRRRDRRDSGPS